MERFGSSYRNGIGAWCVSFMGKDWISGPRRRMLGMLASLDNIYFESLHCARQSAFNEEVAARLQEESSEENVGKKQSKNAKKKQKEFKATSKHQMYAPHNVSINLPSEKDGSKLTCRCLFEGLGSRGVWLELTSEVLKHVQHGMKSSEIKERKRAPKRKRADKS